MKYIIIGAGPSGLTMALFLKDKKYRVVEQNNHPGGHASSVKDSGFTFDYGPHIMFSKNKNILDFMIATLGKNVHQCRRNNKISYKGRLIKYPFENDLKSLPLKDNFECLKDYLFNNYKREFKNPKNLKEWLLSHFGSGICEKYLFPYNEKVWHIPIDKMSMIWADRIPLPPTIDIIKSSLGVKTEGYLHQLYYYYPLRGGYQALSDTWAIKVPVKYNFQVKKIIKTQTGFIVTDGKNSFKSDQIISTIPIHELIKIIDIKIPEIVLEAVGNLLVNSTIEVSLGIKGKDKNQFTAVYFPEADFLVNRVNFPKTFSPNNAPKEYYSVQAEIVCRKQDKVWKKNDQEIYNHVINGLIKRRILDNINNIVYKKILRSAYAYVVLDRDYEKNTQIIRNWFPKQGIHLVGRFSYFEYINVDAVIARSLKIASELNKSAVKLEGKKIIK